jgi:hypothetical protein
VLAIVLCVSSGARAEVDGPLGAGAGAESGGATFATASGSIAGEWSHPSAPIDQRGLGELRPDGHGIWWWTGTDEDDRSGVRGEVSAVAVASRVIGRARASARGNGWELELGVEYQPVGDLRDPFWRSGRDVVASELAVTMPAMITWGTRTARAAVGAMGFGFVDRTRRAGALPIDGGFDGVIDFTCLNVQWPGWELGLFDLHVAGHEIIESATATTTTGLSATAAGMDVLSARDRISPTLELRARVGFDHTMPMTEFMTSTHQETYSDPAAPSVMSPRYKLELAERQSDRTASVGIASWARLDPTGTAADVGHMIAGSLGDRVGPIGVQASAQVGRLRREMVSIYAPTEIAPVGTVMWMGRGELAANFRFAAGLDLVGKAYVERSDRDDPRWSVRSDGTIELHGGVDVSAQWQFGRGASRWLNGQGGR